MKFRLVYSERAVKDIHKLDPIAKKRIGEILLRYQDKPLEYAKKLENPKIGSYR